jgi:hypothetical protein
MACNDGDIPPFNNNLVEHFVGKIPKVVNIWVTAGKTFFIEDDVDKLHVCFKDMVMMSVSYHMAIFFYKKKVVYLLTNFEKNIVFSRRK